MENFDTLIALGGSPFLNLFLKAVLVYVAILWFAIVIWVARDIVNRSNNILFQTLVILINIVLPFFGLILYLIIRPGKTLLEKYYEDLEYGFFSEKSHAEQSCPRCHEPLADEFRYCPSCSEKVKHSCHHCRHLYAVRYQVCPYCGKREKKGQKA